MLFHFTDDPGVPHSQHHRNFLKEHVVFKEVTQSCLCYWFYVIQTQLTKTVL